MLCIHVLLMYHTHFLCVDPNTKCSRWVLYCSNYVNALSEINLDVYVLYIVGLYKPSVVMLGSGISSDTLCSSLSFQLPLNIPEKYPD